VCFAEHAGNAMARRLGLAVAPTHYRVHDGTPYLIVERYDRHEEAGVIRRLHQEDCAQALGLPPSLKYESDGGPELSEIAELLRRHTRDPVRDLERLRDWQLINLLIGNYDGHAKNLGLLYPTHEPTPVLAPFYDIVCIELMNRIGVTSYARELAFSFDGAVEPERIRRRDLEAWARAMHFPPKRLLSRLEELADAAPEAARTERTAFAAAHGDNQAYDYFEQSIGDRCRWILNNVIR
jgi:serine/threonine-protein kinase HipA